MYNEQPIIKKTLVETETSKPSLSYVLNQFLLSAGRYLVWNHSRVRHYMPSGVSKQTMHENNTLCSYLLIMYTRFLNANKLFYSIYCNSINFFCGLLAICETVV